ncbi:MAG: hypothetical protein IJ814_03300 [Paludibacteraceae bacterium]|nr:hypothetical protein [Paludibacteraceae bacterium]
MLLPIDQVNWRDRFPYCPETRVSVTNDHAFLYLHYYVKGAQLRALTTADQGPVWEDSCVEFFCQVPGDKYYMNFEANCIGAMVASRRMGRAEAVTPLTPDEMALIRRRCTCPHEAIPERDGVFEWEVELDIPLRLIFREQPPVFPQRLRANFYKCGDKTKLPHFVSWQPIRLPEPDFHRPEYFGEILLT